MALLPLPDAADPSVRSAVAHAARRPVHPAVPPTLRVGTEAQRRSLNALQEGICVVTGQQAGLFGGPLYTLHKAAAAIVNARALEAETGIPCAPVFWLQNEDHDFEEIRRTTVLDAAGTLRTLEVHGRPDEQGCSVGFRALGPSIDAALDGLAEALDGLAHAEEVLDVIRNSHTPDTTASDAFRAGVERLFAPHGLLVVDPLHPDLVEAARPLHVRAIQEAGALSRALLGQVDALGSEPVHVRENSPLCFVHPEGLSGPRFRVEPVAEGFRICGSGERISSEQVHAGPHTTSALLRPVLQDFFLPTAAYVGGPGELRYLAQLPPLWKAFDLPTPLVVLRSRFLLVQRGTEEALHRLGLQVADLHTDRGTLLTRLHPDRHGRPDPDAVQRAVLEEALSALDDFLPHAEAVGDGLPKAVLKTKRHLEHGVSKLLDRYRRTLAQQDAVTSNRLDRVLAELRPHGAPQERVLGWPSFAARVGIDALVEQLLAAAMPFDGTLREVRL